MTDKLSKIPQKESVSAMDGKKAAELIVMLMIDG